MAHRQLIALIAVALLVLAGCEHNSDVVGRPGRTGSLRISPASVNLASFDSEIVLTVLNGLPPYIWAVSDTALGTIAGVDTNGMTQVDSVNYNRTGTAVGINVLAVFDSRGWTATVDVFADGTVVLSVTPSLTTMAPADTTVALTVSGGAAPYTWEVDDASLGAMSSVSGTTAVYTRVAGADGTATIWVYDRDGVAAEITVVQL